MENRIDIQKLEPDAYKAMLALEGYLQNCNKHKQAHHIKTAFKNFK